jgi:hypothetical protein
MDLNSNTLTAFDEAKKIHAGAISALRARRQEIIGELAEINRRLGDEPKAKRERKPKVEGEAKPRQAPGRKGLPKSEETA